LSEVTLGKRDLQGRGPGRSGLAELPHQERIFIEDGCGAEDLVELARVVRADGSDPLPADMGDDRGRRTVASEPDLDHDGRADASLRLRADAREPRFGSGVQIDGGGVVPIRDHRVAGPGGEAIRGRPGDAGSCGSRRRRWR
jgi:hypothetical protein